MKNLIQKIAPIVLTIAGIIGCATYKPILPENSTKPIAKPTMQLYSESKPKGIDLRNGYTVESYLTRDNLDLIASFWAGEVKLQRTDKGYVGKKTGRYLQSADEWNNIFDNVCKLADKTPDKFITDIEVQDLLDSTYTTMREPIWMKSDSDN